MKKFSTVSQVKIVTKFPTVAPSQTVSVYENKKVNDEGKLHFLMSP